MGTFYPALSCNLILRFDEALLSGASLDPKSSEDLAEPRLTFPAGGASEKPGAMKGAADRLSIITAIIPRQASIELPGYRQAGKFSLSLDWRNMPLDPRAIRAVGVEIFVGAVRAEDFSRGMLGEKDDGKLASFLTQRAEDLILAGTVDNHTVSFTDKGSELKLDGRDLRGLFLDAKIAPDTLKGLKVDQPINKVIEELLGRCNMGSEVPVNVEARDWPNGVVPAPAAAELIDRVLLGSGGSKPGMPMKGNSGSLSFWDVVTNFCLLVGAVPYFRGHQLWVRPARSLFEQTNIDKKAGPNAKTPFADGKPRDIKTSKGSFQTPYRIMAYGKNIASLNFERKLGGGSKVPSVVCVSVDPNAPKGQRLVEAEWPEEEKAKVTNVSPSGDQAGNEKLRVPVPGIKDKDRLRFIASQIYEEVGRGEMGGSCSTKDLKSLGGPDDDVDLVRLRPGDAVELRIDASGLGSAPPVVSELNSAASEAPAESARKLAARLGGRLDLAEVLVGTARGRFKNLQSIFRVGNVKYTWAAESGLGVDFDFQNYIEARYDEQSVPAQVAQSLIEGLDKLQPRIDEAAKKLRQNPNKQSAPKAVP